MANKNIISQTIPRLLGRLETSGTNNPVRRRHIAEEGIPRENRCGNLNIRTTFNFRFSPCIIIIIVHHFYCPTNALNYTNLEVKIYVVQNFKRQKKFKNHSDMFRILCDPSTGSTELCLTEITVVCVYGPAVPQTLTTGSKLRCQTPTKHTTKYL